MGRGAARGTPGGPAQSLVCLLSRARCGQGLVSLWVCRLISVLLKSWAAQANLGLIRMSYPSKRNCCPLSGKVLCPYFGRIGLTWVVILGITQALAHQSEAAIGTLRGAPGSSQQRASCLAQTDPLNPQNSPYVSGSTLSPLYRQGTRGFRRLCEVPGVTQLLSGKTGTQTQAV